MTGEPSGQASSESGGTGGTGAAPHYSTQIIQGLASGVIAVDGAGRVITVNAAACDHLNIGPDDLHAGADFKTVAGLEPFAAILEELARTGQGITRREVFVGQGPVARKEIGVSASLLEGPEPNNGAIFLFTDMTERRKIERAAEVNKQLASLGELAAGMVHELRNPLTIISGRAELLLRKLKDDEKLGASLESILAETKLLEKSIAQFLSFAKPFEFQPAPCQVREVVGRALELCRQRADGKAVGLSVVEEGEFGQIHIDAGRMAEAIANIVANAIDAVDEGGHVEVRTRQEGAETIFEIEDDGPGIHLEDAEDLFSPFFTKKRDGTGLGLSIVQRIVFAQGGTVTYGNIDGGGARFEIRIPTVQGQPHHP